MSKKPKGKNRILLNYSTLYLHMDQINYLFKHIFLENKINIVFFGIV